MIDILDKHGKANRHELPIYCCRFEKTDVLNLLKRYLKKLGVEKAKKVQIIADGALWIWDKLKPLLLKLQVKPERIIEILDYYHASEYVHRLVNQMPNRISEHYKKGYLKKFKQLLWEGKSKRVAQICKEIYKRLTKEIKRWMKYLSKHQSKTKCDDYQRDSLMFGSRVIESGIRRIVNLRFKNASTLEKRES